MKNQEVEKVFCQQISRWLEANTVLYNRRNIEQSPFEMFEIYTVFWREMLLKKLRKISDSKNTTVILTIKSDVNKF